MGSEAGDLEDSADRALLDERAGVHGALDVEAFGEIAHVFFAGAGDGGLHGFELFEAGQRGLVGEVVLAGVHALDAQLGADVGDGRRRDELNLGVVENDLQVGDVGRPVFLGERFCGLGMVGIEDILKRGSGLGEAVGLAVDVAVVHGRDGETEFAGADHGVGFAGGGVVHAVVAGHVGFLINER